MNYDILRRSSNGARGPAGPSHSRTVDWWGFGMKLFGMLEVSNFFKEKMRMRFSKRCCTHQNLIPA